MNGDCCVCMRKTGGCEIKEKGDAISKLDISYSKFSQ